MHSSDINNAIEVNNLTKTFRLYASKKDRMLELLLPRSRQRHSAHQALMGVSFQVKKGEIIGIVGQNGSGKSTLLKILTGVVTPTSGSVVTKGRITALLELGAGFNQDLTGLDNVYYLAAIQGVPKREMDERIQEILDFADIGAYASQPVKNYSSGMYVRLAFSLAINIDPDILIVDEALAVGDARFQQKCYRRIREFRDAGKTILICTHGMSAVREFCTRALWIHQGVLREAGDPAVVTELYQNFMLDQENKTVEDASAAQAFDWPLPPLSPALMSYPWVSMSGRELHGTGVATISHMAMVGQGTRDQVTRLSGSAGVELLVCLTARRDLEQASMVVTLNGQLGAPVFRMESHHYGLMYRISAGDAAILSVSFAMPELQNGRYTLSVALRSPEGGDWTLYALVHDALVLEAHVHDARYQTGAQLALSDATFTRLPNKV
jgi:ABC-type polysaccharide/polyol phosphate transport system ATPase subunit